MPRAKEILPLTILGTCAGTVLEYATKAQTGIRNIGLQFFNLGARRVGWSKPRPDHSTSAEKPGTYCTRCWVGSAADLEGIRSPYRPARSKSLYRLSNPPPRPPCALQVNLVLNYCAYLEQERCSPPALIPVLKY